MQDYFGSYKDQNKGLDKGFVIIRNDIDKYNIVEWFYQTYYYLYSICDFYDTNQRFYDSEKSLL